MRGGSPLGRVLGRGSAKNGVHHWWVQRVTAVALVPLTLWFLIALLALPGLDHASVSGFIGAPWHAVLLCLLVAVVSWHSQLGVQVVVEDYVHGHGLKLATLLLVQFAHVLVAAAGIFAVLKIAFGTH
jgi:succinate dehydrogenase / fumarate reductase, membrane anchor subunit